MKYSTSKKCISMATRLNKINTFAFCATAIATWFLLFGVFIAWSSLKDNQNNILQAYDKSRKEFAINILLDIDNLDTGLSCVSLISDLEANEIATIFDYKELVITSAHIAKLKGCIAGQKENDMLTSKNKLTKIGSYYVRSKVLNTLNKLEIYRAASCKDLLDKETIKMLFTNTRFPYFKIAITKIRALNSDIGYGYLDAYVNNKENPCNEQNNHYSDED